MQSQACRWHNSCLYPTGLLLPGLSRYRLILYQCLIKCLLPMQDFTHNTEVPGPGEPSRLASVIVNIFMESCRMNLEVTKTAFMHSLLSHQTHGKGTSRIHCIHTGSWLKPFLTARRILLTSSLSQNTKMCLVHSQSSVGMKGGRA
ncbi:hypothetical protein IEO21_10804 [Rhodonia placenta]|uniref:Uncharacterized protein n=1 Tax=Rhodonia placenta TaxID=104341 RepID=A0A8H7TX33_9APHY|nr:hypothetical protein IEO21_10804 [Postia placenta]